jgi:sugar fermentation stimulation protein A
MVRGTYGLVMKMTEPRPIQIGKLGCGVFPAGYYVYVGSALNGLGKRLARHESPRKNRHWHIDYLLEHATLVATRTIISRARLECAISRQLGGISQGVPMKGFGSSDCRCRSHLYYFPESPLSNPLFEVLWTQGSSVVGNNPQELRQEEPTETGTMSGNPVRLPPSREILSSAPVPPRRPEERTGGTPVQEAAMTCGSKMCCHIAGHVIHMV